jgi:hypothetical protein
VEPATFYIKIDFIDIGWEDVNWIGPTATLVNRVLKLFGAERKYGIS